MGEINIFFSMGVDHENMTQKEVLWEACMLKQLNAVPPCLGRLHHSLNCGKMTSDLGVLK